MNQTSFKKGNVPWNKGLNKTDPRVAQYGLVGSKTKLELSRKGLLPASWNKGLTKATDIRLANLSKTLTGIKRRPESIEKSRINAGKRIREQYQNGERKLWGLDPKNKAILERVKKKFGSPAAQLKAFRANGKHQQNQLEKHFQSILDIHFPNKWDFVGDGKLRVGTKFPDFVNKITKKAILINGIYWHTKFKNREKLSRPTIEVLERYPYEEHGYKVLHIWEDELALIKNGKYLWYEDITGVLTKIKQFDII